jgi:linker histone H1 and H5 family
LLEAEKGLDSRSSGASMKMSYSVMAVEAVIALGERHGSSLVAIRKYIQANYPLKQQQTASFNSLTLKGVSKAVAMNELEKLKHSYKVTQQEKEKRKEKDRRANYIASGRSPRDAKVRLKNLVESAD